MKKRSILLLLLLPSLSAFAQQSVEKIFKKLDTINQRVVDFSCTGKSGMILSDRGLNYFFADKLASYLAGEGDISLFKSYATLDASDGVLNINHNFPTKDNETGRIKSLFTLGARSNIADGFAAIFREEKFSNELGLSLKQTWFKKGAIKFYGCKSSKDPGEKKTVPSDQKQTMNLARALLLHQLHNEMLQKEREFSAAYKEIKSKEIPGDRTESAIRSELENEFYTELRKTYLDKFAKKEAELLESTKSYNRLRVQWYTISAFVPLTKKVYNVAGSFTSNFSEKQMYPWELNASYNWIRESRLNGRSFFHLSAGVFLNNGVKTEELEKINLQQYKNLGGVDTVHFAELESDESYIGNYKNFVTPLLKAQFVWFPPEKNIGVSIQLEKNFGKFDPLNGKIGVPIRLNDKDGDPNVNFEIQVRTFDLANSVASDKSIGKKTSVGISVGLPFSSVIY